MGDKKVHTLLVSWTQLPRAYRMSKTARLKLFLVIAFFYISYFSAFGMELMETQNNMQREYDDTFQKFCNIIRLGPEHIKIKIERKHWHEYDPSGVYQLIPYYVKVFPEDIETSRFIIQKQPFSGEWQLTEIYHKIWRRTIYPFLCGIGEENKKSEKITIESFDVLQKEIKIMKKNILNLEKEMTLKNENITQINESLTFLEETIMAKENQTKNLNSKIHLQRLLFEEKIRFLKNENFVKLKQKYFKKQEKLEKKFEKNIFSKEKQIHDLYATVKKLKTTNENLKSTNDDLKLQLELLNQQIDSLNTEINSFRTEKTNLAHKWIEEQLKCKKLELALNKEETFIKESESKKKLKKQTEMNTFTEQKNNVNAIAIVMEDEIQDSLNQIQTKDETNLKSFAKVNQIHDNIKTKQVEKLLEQNSNTTISSKPSTNENVPENKIEKIWKKKSKTKTNAPIDEKIQALDSIKELIEEKLKREKLEFALNKEETFSKESESKKKSKKQIEMNTSTEQNNNVNDIAKVVMEDEIQDSLKQIQTKDETNLKSFAKVNHNLKTKKVEKLLEQNGNTTILSQPSTFENMSEKEIEKNLKKKSKTKTKAPNDEKIQTLDSIKQMKGQQISASTDDTPNKENLTEHEKTSEENLVEKTTTVLDTSLVKNMNEVDENIKKDKNILDDKIEYKCENEYKNIILYATKMYEKLQAEWMNDYLNTIKYPEIMPKITYVLTNMDKLKMNLNFQFEFALIYWGFIAYFDEKTAKAITYDTENDIVKHHIYVDVLEKLKNKYSELGNNAMKNIQDPKQKILFKCLLDNTKLFQVEKYRFEALLLKSGLREAAKEILEELKKSIELFSNDSINMFNNTQENPMLLESTSVKENLAHLVKELNEVDSTSVEENLVHLAKQLNETDKNIRKDKNTLDQKIDNKWENECKCIIFYAKKIHEILRADWDKECIHAFKNQEIKSKINYFLKHMDTIKMNPKYNYELVFIYWGSFNYAEDQSIKASSDEIENDILTFYSQEVNQTKLQAFWSEIGNKMYLSILRYMKVKFDILLQNAKQNIQDSRQKILCDNFFLNPDLFEEEQFEAEFLLLKRGHLQEGPKEILEVFKKAIELFSVDSKLNVNKY